MYAAVGILHKSLSKAFAKMHRARVNVLLGAVSAFILGRRLVLMDMARSWPDVERVRGPLKKLDRLLGNQHLQAEKQFIYGAMAQWLLNCARPIIVVDWSDLQGHGLKFLLRAGVPVNGQTMTILEEVYEEQDKQKPRVEREFLRRLRALLPTGVKPIIVTDAGFKRPWFRAVRKLGWDYLGRVRNERNALYLGVATAAMCVRELYERATSTAQRFEYAGLGQEETLRCDLVLYKQPKCDRVRTTHRGRRSQSIRSKRAEKSAREPWLLATSLSRDEFTAKQIVKLYAKRMQIEKSFRDLKCVQYGCAFDQSLTRSCARLGVLLLIHAMAAFVAWLTGLTLDERAAIDKHGGIYAARARRHYSLLRLGWEALRRGDRTILISALYDTLRSWPSATSKTPAHEL
jgi:hypothetical protein